MINKNKNLAALVVIMHKFMKRNKDINLEGALLCVA